MGCGECPHSHQETGSAPRAPVSFIRAVLYFFFKLFYILVSCSRIPFGKGIPLLRNKNKAPNPNDLFSLVHTLWFSRSAGKLLLLLFPTYQISLHIITTLWFCLWALGCWLGHFLKLVKGKASRDLGAMDLPHRPAVGRERQSETVLRPTQVDKGDGLRQQELKAAETSREADPSLLWIAACHSYLWIEGIL